MPALHTRVHPPSLRRRRDPRPSPALTAQCTFPRSTDADGTRCHSRGHLRRMEPRLARPLSLSLDDSGMTSTGAFFLLQAAGGAGPSPLFQIGIQFALILAIFYFLMIRPQQKQRRQHEESLRNLQKGDEIVTTGGIVGQVVHIRESLKDGVAVKGMDDQVTI